jgi:hypothetical protein
MPEPLRRSRDLLFQQRRNQWPEGVDRSVAVVRLPLAQPDDALLVGQKAPLKREDIWAIRVRLELEIENANSRAHRLMRTHGIGDQPAVLNRLKLQRSGVVLCLLSIQYKSGCRDSKRGTRDAVR